MRKRTTTGLSWSLALLCVLLGAGAFVFNVKNRSAIMDYAGGASQVVAITFVLLGAVLASRRPSNPIGWLFIATAVLFALDGLATQVDTYSHLLPSVQEAAVDAIEASLYGNERR